MESSIIKAAREFEAQVSKKAKLDDRTLQKIRSLVDQNNHTEAHRLAANAIGAKKLEKLFGLIADIQKIEGGIPNDVYKYRYGLYKQLLRLAKTKLPQEDYEALSSI